MGGESCTVLRLRLMRKLAMSHNHWSWLIQPFSDKPRQELLSGWIWLGPMCCRTIPFRTRPSKFGKHYSVLHYTTSSVCIVSFGYDQCQGTLLHYLHYRHLAEETKSSVCRRYLQALISRGSADSWYYGQALSYEICHYEWPTNPQFSILSPVQSLGVSLYLNFPAAVDLEIVLH